MINIETIKFVKMLDELAELIKVGIFEFKKATPSDTNSKKLFYDQEAQDRDSDYKVVLDMCIIDDPECLHHDVVSYDDSYTNEFTVRAITREDDIYVTVKFFNSNDEIVIEDGRWYFI